jgi:hypothetical protein
MLERVKRVQLRAVTQLSECDTEHRAKSSPEVGGLGRVPLYRPGCFYTSSRARFPPRHKEFLTPLSAKILLPRERGQEDGGGLGSPRFRSINDTRDFLLFAHSERWQASSALLDFPPTFSERSFLRRIALRRALGSDSEMCHHIICI